MKKYILFGLLAMLFTFVPVKARNITLPTGCAKLLDQKFKGWEMATVNKDIAEWFKTSNHPFQPNLIKGDFNGDAKTDFAVMIQRSVDSQPTNSTIVFIKSSKGYKMFELENGDGDYILFDRKGTTAFDHEKNRSFKYRTDAVTVGLWEKSAVSHIWRNGKFVGVFVSD